MAIHFTSAEFEVRSKNLCRALNSASLDGILLFKQESMYYLTGYETFGFCFFQCLYLDAVGRKVLITRAPDLRQAQHTSTIKDIRIWPDDASESAVQFLRRMLDDLGIRPTVTLNAKVCEDYPEVAGACLESGWEFNAHSYEQLPMHKLDDERSVIEHSLSVIENL